MNQKIKTIFILIIGSILVSALGCKEYIYGPQPNIINENEFIPKLNIFGVLRPDSLYGKPASMIRVDKTTAVDSVNSDTLLITDARVTIYEMDSNNYPLDSFRFEYTDYDSTYMRNDYRPPVDRDFMPKTNTTYKIVCEKEGYEKVTGYTTMPEEPNLIDGIKMNKRELHFQIKRDEKAELYEFYLLKGRKSHYDKKLKPDTGNIKVTIKVPPNFTKPFDLKIYAYDNNLSEYNTYSLYYKPNTYQPPYSTVENGYGCFGSMNILRTKVE